MTSPGRAGRTEAEKWQPLPEWLVFYNGQTFHRCDMLIGPCGCGAWHREEDLLGRVLDEIERRKP